MNLLNRIKIMEKQAHSNKIDICPILTEVVKREGRIFYKNIKGVEREFLESEHTERPIFTFINSWDDSTPISNL